MEFFYFFIEKAQSFPIFRKSFIFTFLKLTFFDLFFFELKEKIHFEVDWSIFFDNKKLAAAKDMYLRKDYLIGVYFLR